MKLHKSNRTLIAGIATMSLVMVGGLLGLAVLSDVLTPVEAQAAVYTAVGSSGETISVAGAGDVQLNVLPSVEGGFVMGKQSLTITTGIAGYQAYISMNGNDNNLYLGGDTESSSSLTATGGTYTAPGSSMGTNAWGYAVPQIGESSYTDTLAPNNGFGSEGYIDGSQAEGASKWAAVPTKSNITMIQSVDGAKTSGQELNVWYAAKANNSRSAGVYSGEVAYTVLSTAAVSNTAASISPSYIEGNIGGGNAFEVTLGLNISSSILTNIKSNSHVYIGHDPDSWVECPLDSATLNGAGNLVLGCTDQAQEISGRYDVKIVVSDGSNSYGTYYIGGGVEYVTSGGVEATEIDATPFYSITNMQDMIVKNPEASLIHYVVSDTYEYTDTIDYCKAVKTPSSSVKTSFAATLSAYTSGVGSETTGNIIPTRTLTDARDNQQYTIRKLADGNCWMTENLRFGAAVGTGDAPTSRPWNSTTDPDLTDTTTASSINNLTTARISNASYCGYNFTGSNYTYPQICTYQANTAANYDGKTKYGVLYNYCAATGGTVCNSSSMSADATGSICPKGWKLPGMTASATGSGADTTGTTKSYNNLANSYGYGNTSSGFTGMLADATAGPINLVRAGLANNGSLSNRSVSGNGNYWASTNNTSSGYASILFLADSNSYYVSRSGNARFFGFSVRCVSASS